MYTSSRGDLQGSLSSREAAGKGGGVAGVIIDRFRPPENRAPHVHAGEFLLIHHVPR